MVSLFLLFVFISCETGDGGKQESFDTTAIYTITAPIYNVGGIEYVAMPGTDHTTITLNYVDRNATLTENATDLPVKIDDMNMSISIDAALNLKTGWNIIQEKQTFDTDSLSSSVKAETMDEFLEAGK